MVFIAVFGEEVFWGARVSRELGGDVVCPELAYNLNAGCSKDGCVVTGDEDVALGKVSLQYLAGWNYC